MTLPAPTYDLVLLLDTLAEPDVRAKIVADSRASVEVQGELLRYDEWGERPLSYPIEKKTSAEYHLFQFHAGTPELLSGLDRTLRITDGVLRFRIVKLAPGVPEAPSMGTGASAAATEAPQSGEAPAPAPAAPAAEAPAEAAAPPAEAAAPETEPAAAPEAEAEVASEAPVGEPA